ncbi:MAG: J domain-containing protein [Anaerolineales bacterium]
MPTHYQTLGVPENADHLTIRRAYRHLMRKTHPDFIAGERARLLAAGDTVGLAQLDEEKARAQAQALNAAYAVLSDPAKRRAYDTKLAARRRQAPRRTASSGGPKRPVQRPATPYRTIYRAPDYTAEPKRPHSQPPPNATTDFDAETRLLLYGFLVGFFMMALLMFVALASVSG